MLMLFLVASRTYFNRLLIMFSLSIWLWALLLILSTSVGIPVPLIQSVMWLSAVLACYMLLKRLGDDFPAWSGQSLLVLFLAVLAGIWAVWWSRNATWTLAVGIVVPILASVLLAALLVIERRVDGGVHRLVRFSGQFFTLGYLLVLLTPIINVPLGLLVVSLGLLAMARQTLRQQIRESVEKLSREIVGVRRDLREKTRILSDQNHFIEKLEKELANANNYKTEFLSNMSHELRTPLNSIIGYSELLQNGTYGDLNPKQVDRLARIYRNGTHLSQLIDAILDFNKIDAGKIEIQPETTDVYDLIEIVINRIEPRCLEKGLQLVIDLDEKLPSINADQYRIQQVLLNLLDNAIKFTNKGRITIEGSKVTVSKGRADNFPLPMMGWLPDGDWIILTVIDTGIGIAPEDQVKIFDQFSQADSTSTREYDGIGLGLPTAKKLVELHGGIIWLRSMPLEGSSFFVALPVRVMPQASTHV